MKTKIKITFVLSVLMVWASTAMAVDPVKIEKTPKTYPEVFSEQFQN